MKLWGVILTALLSVSLQAQEVMDIEMSNGIVITYNVSELQKLSWRKGEFVPNFTTENATNVSYLSATLNGTLDIPDELCSEYAFGFEFSTSSKFPEGQTEVLLCENLHDGKFSLTVKDLEVGKRYYYRAYFRTHHGQAKNFTTKKVTAGEYVDLGLPSGTLWGTKNVGAQSPTEIGLFFQWADTKGYKNDPSDGKAFTYGDCKYVKGVGSTCKEILKYNTKSKYGNVDNKTELDLEDDAAYVNMGSDWRMPSIVQCNELIDEANTESHWTEIDYVHGRLFISKTNGNSIFLPSTGYRDGSDYWEQSTVGRYFTRELSGMGPEYPAILGFDAKSMSTYGVNRFGGRVVRPVRK